LTTLLLDNDSVHLQIITVTRREGVSPGETVAIGRHFSPEILELSGLVSLGARRAKASERF
ncbi:hypothetical protein A2U01_0093386, partial [Trifolium medium]|nr:hypothetical protein [Trifolium medium]